MIKPLIFPLLLVSSALGATQVQQKLSNLN
jgi:hypothetical protein